VLAAVGAIVVVIHIGLDAISLYAERRGAYLWKKDDFLRLVSPVYHVGRGPGRLLIYGPSEAREALLPEELAKFVTHLMPYQNAQSWGTLEDALVTLDYIERAYGPSAIPEAIVLGVTPRFVANIRVRDSSRLLDGINKYSPRFRVAGGGHPPALVEKTPLEKLRARLNVAALEPERYRRGLYAVVNQAFGSAVPALRARERKIMRPAKYIERAEFTEAQTDALFELPHWQRVHAWDPTPDRARIEHQIGLLLGYTRRHGVRLYVVNLPEHPRAVVRYDSDRYDTYLTMTRAAFGTTPFLNLREFLAADEFYDEAHATWHGAIRLGEAVGEFIMSHEAREHAAAR
jgi:hypothetical protein